MAVIQKKKILFISHEFSPYNEENEFSKVLNALAVKSNDSGYEVRVIMPRFGTINERRHRLHEVVRLSGININVDKQDYPLVIKVASLPNARLQVYFMDNEDMYKRKLNFHEEDGRFFDDNALRTIFFCKGALETVKKFGWPPDLIHVHGWMSALIPMFIKSYYKKEPVFANSKLIFSPTRTMVKDDLGEGFRKQLLASSPLKEKDVEVYDNGANRNLFLGGTKYADAIVIPDTEVEKQVVESVKPTRSKKVLKFDSPIEDLSAIMDLYNNLAGN
ncbi:MAG TPA: glycogen/starch synthase [Chitinophagaceae bacterium]|nr:glycogen/starch synthase [Chitinophagaceae bacterium]HNF71179.1 glycogen/starch synthase [Chitinophagaceae bacterium]